MSGFTVYDRETGEPVWCQHAVDAREHLESGRFVREQPENAEVPKSSEELSYSEARRLSQIAEKARLGSSISPGERGDLGAYQSAAEQFSPEGSGSVPAPGVEPVLDTFNLATGDRAELMRYLRSQGDDPPGALSTSNLRERAKATFLERK